MPRLPTWSRTRKLTAAALVVAVAGVGGLWWRDSSQAAPTAVTQEWAPMNASLVIQEPDGNSVQRESALGWIWAGDSKAKLPRDMNGRVKFWDEVWLDPCASQIDVHVSDGYLVDIFSEPKGCTADKPNGFVSVTRWKKEKMLSSVSVTNNADGSRTIVEDTGKTTVLPADLSQVKTYPSFSYDPKGDWTVIDVTEKKVDTVIFGKDHTLSDVNVVTHNQQFPTGGMEVVSVNRKRRQVIRSTFAPDLSQKVEQLSGPPDASSETVDKTVAVPAPVLGG